MLVGNLLPGVQGYRPVARVNGVVRAVEDVSWSTGIEGDLPSDVQATSVPSGAKGTISWAPQTAVQSRPVSPWGKVAGWPPSSGDLVQIQVTDGATTWTRYTGVIDKTTGDADSGYQSVIQDFRDEITGKFTHEALLRHMTPFIEDGDYRSIGLNFWYPLTSALRKAGFCNVPPVEGPSALSVPLQGSVWPEAGTVRDAGGSGGTAHASFFLADFGYAAGSFSAAYLPRLDEAAATPVQLTLVIPGTHTGVSTMDVYYGNGPAIRLRVNNSRGVTAFHSPTSAGTWVSVASVGGAPSNVTTVVQLLIKGSSWDLRTSNGASSTGTQSRGAGSMSLVQVNADADARIAGVQVSHPQSTVREFASLDFTPTMRFESSGLASTMDMMPALRGRSINDLVNEIMEATLTASWWDETGTLILRPSDRLRSGAPVASLDTSVDIESLSWEDSLLAVRSGVDVTWLDPMISKTYQYRFELWRGRTQTLLSTADPIEDFVTPESGIEWFGVDRALRFLADTDGPNQSGWGAYNRRRGSYCGVWYSNADGDPTTAGDARVHYEPMYADSLKVTTSIVSLISTYEANTETHPEATALKPYLRGQSLPVVRGMGRGEWIDATYSTTAGMASASVLEHDLSYWGQEYFEDGSVAQRIADYLAGMVTAPHPTITDLTVAYDPRRQLGDVYTIISAWLGIELRVLVVAIDEAHGGGSFQSLTVRVVSATNTRGVTYDDLAEAWQGGNYASLNAAWAALTYNDMAANPLEGAPS